MKYFIINKTGRKWYENKIVIYKISGYITLFLFSYAINILFSKKKYLNSCNKFLSYGLTLDYINSPFGNWKI